jgi:hypothetical protein
MKVKLAAVAACSALVTGVVMVTGAFGATSSGTFNMAAGSQLGVVCPNGLSNTGRTTNAETVNCAANPVTTTTQPVTTTTMPVTTTTQPVTTTTVPQTTTTTAPSGGACVTSSASGDACGPYLYPPDSASNGSNTYVGQDMWNPVPGETGTLTAYSPGDWSDAFNVPAGNTSVTAYPSIGQAPDGNRAVTSYTQITSSFAENMNVNPGTIGEAAYDVWTGPTSNVWAHETMIQFDFANNTQRCASGGLPILATVNFVEPSTGQSQAWDFCEYGSGDGAERIWNLHGASEQSGSVDILAMYQWEIAHGYIPSSDTLGTVGFGAEVCSTGGQPENIQVSAFSLTALPNP